MRIALKPPVDVQQVDEDAEILIVAGCALGFVDGHDPHVLSLVDGCELSVSGVAVDDLLVAIDSQDPRKLERTDVLKALQAASSLEFRRPKPVLVPAAAAKNTVADESTAEPEEKDSDEKSAEDSASDSPSPIPRTVVEISDEDEPEDVEPHRRKVHLVPRVKLNKPANPRVTLKKRSPLPRERALERLKQSMAETREQLEAREQQEEEAADAEGSLPRRAGALRPLAVLKAALKAGPQAQAVRADRWRAPYNELQAGSNHAAEATSPQAPATWAPSSQSYAPAWQAPAGYHQSSPSPQHTQVPSQHPSAPHWQAHWGWNHDQSRHWPAPSGAPVSAEKGSGKGWPRPPRPESTVSSGPRSPFDVRDAVASTAVVEAKTKAAVSDEAKMRDASVEVLDRATANTASCNSSAIPQVGGRLATRAAAVSPAAVPPAVEGGNMQLESSQAIEKKRKRDEVDNQMKELLQKYTNHLKIVMAKVNDPETPEHRKEQFQTMLTGLQAKILDMSPPETKARRETPPWSPANARWADPEVPAGAFDLELPQSADVETGPEVEAEPVKADKRAAGNSILEPAGQ